MKIEGTKKLSKLALWSFLLVFCIFIEMIILLFAAMDVTLRGFGLLILLLLVSLSHIIGIVLATVSLFIIKRNNLKGIPLSIISIITHMAIIFSYLYLLNLKQIR